MEEIRKLLESNRQWAAEITARDPGFFRALSEQQTPRFLWIGCSDSRISPTSSIGLLPGTMFVHRNVANIVTHSDINCLSAIQFAVDVLKVRHIIVCGHYGCGGVHAAFADARQGLIDNWLRHIQDVMRKYEPLLAEQPDTEARMDKLCELNVIEQMFNVGETGFVQDAWSRGQTLFLHGWIYRIADGIYRDMKVTISNETELKAMRELDRPQYSLTHNA